MTRPRRYVVRMVLFLAAVAVVVALLFPGLQRAFWTDAPLNSLILAVFLAGILYNFRQVSVSAARSPGSRTSAPTAAASRRRRACSPLAAVLGDRRKRLSLSPPVLRSLLDEISARLDKIPRPRATPSAFSSSSACSAPSGDCRRRSPRSAQVISSLQIGGADIARMFDTLKGGLAAPLAGMGTAFPTSLFGLAGSLVLGFLDLQTAQAQNRFFNETEDWLATATRLPGASIVGDVGDASVPAYVQALLEQTAESLEGLQRTLQRGEESRIASNAHLMSLAEKIGLLTDQMRTEQALMARLSETQNDLRPLLGRLTDGISQIGSGLDEPTRAHIRNIDVYMARLIEEMISGREEMVRQIRSDIKLLARTIAAVAEEPDRA